MPDIDYRAEPKELTPPGVTKFQITQAGQNINEQTHVEYFDLRFKDLRNGIVFRDTVSLTSKAVWKLESLLASVGLVIPDAGVGYRVTCDDLVDRIGYGIVEHRKTKNGRDVAQFALFLPRDTALTKAPELASIPNPPGALTDAVPLSPSRKAKAAAVAPATLVEAPAPTTPPVPATASTTNGASVEPDIDF